MVMSVHNTTLATVSLDLTHSLARYLQALVILEARGISKVSIALVAGDPSVVLNVGRMAEQASHDASHLFSATLPQHVLHSGIRISQPWPPSAS